MNETPSAWSQENAMPRVGGVSFRCSCGCNVFKRRLDDLLRYKCNACGATYIGEPISAVKT